MDLMPEEAILTSYFLTSIYNNMVDVGATLTPFNRGFGSDVWK